MPRSHRLLTPALALAAAAACAHAASSLSRDDLARLSAASPVAAVWLPSPAPYVECPGDEGEKLWERGFGARSQPALTVPAAWGGGGGTWQQIENDYTERLRRNPPIDPAAATAAALVSRAAASAGPVRFAQPERAPSGAVPPGATHLRLETTRWVLVGCFFDYAPWFNVRASLVDGASGRVFWQDACGGLYPDADAGERSREELEWNGMALYRGDLERRAQRCAAELLGKLERASAARR